MSKTKLDFVKLDARHARDTLQKYLEDAAGIYARMANEANKAASRVYTEPDAARSWFTSYAMGYVQNIRFDLIANSMAQIAKLDERVRQLESQQQ